MAYDANTIIGCHFDSAQWNGSRFEDGAIYKYWFNQDANGNTTTYYKSNTGVYKFGDACISFQPYSSKQAAVVIFNNSQITTSTGFSLDFWVKVDALGGMNTRFYSTAIMATRLTLQAQSYDSSYERWSCQLLVRNSSDNNIFNITSGIYIPRNVWTHVYVGRNTVGGASGSHTYYYAINGVLTTVGTYNGTNGTFGLDSSYMLELGGTSTPNYTASSVLFDEVRVSNKARWTTNFPVPTQEYSSTYTGEIAAASNSFSYIIGGLD